MARTCARLAAALTAGSVVAVGLVACTRDADTVVRATLQAGEAGEVALGRARMVVPSGVLDRKTVASVAMVTGPAGEPAYAFSVGDARIDGTVTLELPAPAPVTLVAAMTYYENSRDAWVTHSARYDAARGVLVARVRHLSTWTALPIDALMRAFQAAFAVPSGAPPCPEADDVQERDGVSLCRSATPDGTRFFVVNGSNAVLRIAPLGSRVVAVSGPRGTASDRLVAELLQHGRTDILPPGARAELAAGAGGSVRLIPQVSYTAASAAANAVAFVGGPVSRAAEVLAVADCVTLRGGAALTPTNALRLALDCLGAGVGVLARIPRAVIRFGEQALELSSALLGTIASALDLTPVIDAMSTKTVTFDLVPLPPEPRLWEPQVPSAPPGGTQSPGITTVSGPEAEGTYRCPRPSPACTGR